MKIYTAPGGDIDIPKLDILSLLFGEINNDNAKADLPRSGGSSTDECPADSKAGQALEETRIHVAAANPSNSITKRQARFLTKRVAHILRHRLDVGSEGPGKDVVLAVLHGGPFAPVLFYGIVAAGGIYSGASTEYTPLELATQIKSSEATTLLCSSECEELAVEAAKQSNLPVNRVLVADDSVLSGWTLRSVTDQRNLLCQSSADSLIWQTITEQHLLQNTTVCLLYSSGTTGEPPFYVLPICQLAMN